MAAAQFAVIYGAFFAAEKGVHTGGEINLAAGGTAVANERADGLHATDTRLAPFCEGPRFP
jgi:hypothetical protein